MKERLWGHFGGLQAPDRKQFVVPEEAFVEVIGIGGCGRDVLFGSQGPKFLYASTTSLDSINGQVYGGRGKATGKGGIRPHQLDILPFPLVVN